MSSQLYRHPSDAHMDK